MQPRELEQTTPWSSRLHALLLKLPPGQGSEHASGLHLNSHCGWAAQQHKRTATSAARAGRPQSVWCHSLRGRRTAQGAAQGLVGLQLWDAQIGDAQIGDAQIGDAQIGDAQIGDAQIGDAQIGDAQIGDAQIGDAQIGDMPK